MSEAKIAIGSFSNWLLFRCISLFSFVGGLVLILASLHPFELGFFCMGMFVAVVGLASAHDQIYGMADEHGIRFRQYFAPRFLRWEEIAMITWVHADLVYFHSRSHRRSHRVLAAQALRNRPWTELYSQEPEVVRWLLLVKPTGADGIEIRNPGASARWVLGKNPAVAKQILQFMLVVIVVIAIFSMIYVRR